MLCGSFGIACLTP
ncbi:hypothetical protein L3V22_22995 [Vibrio parahaemolyticus]|nr:hypothetical protein [Vibrio parahaemolyticus]MCL1717135.1 hypothetical protein [Vibrio parahaemolyticus]MCL1726258.1 hypothetical protein [Vibrio parahaemolyticus]MCL1739927.1 hypothetical protein [Vibrio parahaemolyticus]MCL1749033.1 hypothetical protein [Vibrio parahaemolyticus]